MGEDTKVFFFFFPTICRNILGHKELSFLFSTSFYNVGIHRQYVMWERERRRYVATNLTTATLIAILHTASIAATSFRHSSKITSLYSCMCMLERQPRIQELFEKEDIRISNTTANETSAFR